MLFESDTFHNEPPPKKSSNNPSGTESATQVSLAKIFPFTLPID